MAGGILDDFNTVGNMLLMLGDMVGDGQVEISRDPVSRVWCVAWHWDNERWACAGYGSTFREALQKACDEGRKNQAEKVERLQDAHGNADRLRRDVAAQSSSGDPMPWYLGDIRRIDERFGLRRGVVLRADDDNSIGLNWST